MAKILSPNKDYTGVSASVPFVNGVGETNNHYLIEWFKAHGYAVENEVEAEDVNENERVPDSKKSSNHLSDDISQMNVEQLKAYAAAHNIDLGKSTTHEGILKKVQDALK